MINAAQKLGTGSRRGPIWDSGHCIIYLDGLTSLPDISRSTDKSTPYGIYICSTEKCFFYHL